MPRPAQHGKGFPSRHMFSIRSYMQTVPPIEELRARIARMERRGPRRNAAVLRFGAPAIDRHLPGGGLVTGALHEVAGTGADTEHGAAAALLVAGLLARRRGPVLWALGRAGPFPPPPAGGGAP